MLRERDPAQKRQSEDDWAELEEWKRQADPNAKRQPCIGDVHAKRAQREFVEVQASAPTACVLYRMMFELAAACPAAWLSHVFVQLVFPSSTTS